MNNIPLEKQIEQEKDSLERYAESLVHDDTEAYELVEETMVRANESIQQYKTFTGLRGWLCILMRDTLVSRRRRLSEV